MDMPLLDLWASSLGPSQIIYMTLNTINDVTPMNVENHPLVTNALVEFEKYPIEVQNFEKITNQFRGIYGIQFKLIRKNQITACHRFETIGF